MSLERPARAFHESGSGIAASAATVPVPEFRPLEPSVRDLEVERGQMATMQMADEIVGGEEDGGDELLHIARTSLLFPAAPGLRSGGAGPTGNPEKARAFGCQTGFPIRRRRCSP